MSQYKVDQYIQKKLNDIIKSTSVYKAYNLGIAQGFAWSYEGLKTCCGREVADKWAEQFNYDDEISTITRTIIGLSNDDTNEKTERLIKKLKEFKSPDSLMSDEDRDMIEGFLEYLQKKTDPGENK